LEGRVILIFSLVQFLKGGGERSQIPPTPNWSFMEGRGGNSKSKYYIDKITLSKS